MAEEVQILADDETSSSGQLPFSPPRPPPNKYLILRPEKARFVDLLRFLLVSDRRASSYSFLETETETETESTYDYDHICDQEEEAHRRAAPLPWDRRWVIVVSIIVRRIIAIIGKPLEFSGMILEFALNLLSQNGGLPRLLLNLLRGTVVVPRRGSDTFISTIGQLDSRVDLHIPYSGTLLPSIGNRALMDLCMMASKLAYENANVVERIVTHRWEMHFVEFYNCWDDYQKENSTQVFIMCDKPTDASLILISFRGTEPFDPDDWSTDFDYSWYEIPEVGKVHMGFLEALGLGNRAQASTFQVCLTDQDQEGELIPTKDGMSAYFLVRRKLKSLLGEHKNAKFIVTGHSLGGALAILLPAVLLLHKEEEMMERLLGVYTFGQPRVGDRQLERFMKAHVCDPVPKYFRLVYSFDLVPRLPYDDTTFLFKHFGSCLYYDSFYTEQYVEEEPNRNYLDLRFLVPEYLTAVCELVRSLTAGYIYGPEYKENWFSVLLRVFGLVVPGISAHSPTNYVNSIRLGRRGCPQTSTIRG